MTPEEVDRHLPSKVGFRRFEMTVQNGLGDVATALVYVREDRSPRQYAATAIAKARTIIPNEGPWKLRTTTEHANRPVA